MNKILLFERNTFIRDALRNILQGRFPDIVIKEVFSFADCEIALRDFNPNILFIGTAEHDSDGMERLRHIRAGFPAMSIIFFTEYDIDEYRKRAVMEGVNYVISKELWTGSEILALVKTILTMNNFMERVNTEGRPIDEKILTNPIERRRKDWKGRAIERKFLALNPDRRKWN